MNPINIVGAAGAATGRFIGRTGATTGKSVATAAVVVARNVPSLDEVEKFVQSETFQQCKRIAKAVLL